MTTPLLSIKDLSIYTKSNQGPKTIVDNISFDVYKEKIAIVGESGSGKTLTARAILGLLPKQVGFHAKSLQFKGQDLTSPTVLKRIRGKDISLILQDPKFSLNPVLTAGYQLTECLRVLQKKSKKEAKDEALALLEEMQIKDPIRVFKSYPCELSGGLAQRVMIAIMLSNKPQLLIADEPTSSCDKHVEKDIIGLLQRQVDERNMGLLFITHNLTLAKAFCDKIIVMYQGQIVETLDANNLADANHPYTQGLLNCLPSLDHKVDYLPTVDLSQFATKEQL